MKIPEISKLNSGVPGFLKMRSSYPEAKPNHLFSKHYKKSFKMTATNRLTNLSKSLFWLIICRVQV